MPWFINFCALAGLLLSDHVSAETLREKKDKVEPHYDDALKDMAVTADGEVTNLMVRKDVQGKLTEAVKGAGTIPDPAAEIVDEVEETNKKIMETLKAATARPMTEADKVMQAFKTLDTNMDGQIHATDMGSLVAFWATQLFSGTDKDGMGMGLSGGQFKGGPESVLQELVSDMDADGDGKVEFADYAAFATKLKASPSFAQMLQEKRDLAFIKQMTTNIPELGKLIKEERAKQLAQQQEQEAQTS